MFKAVILSIFLLQANGPEIRCYASPERIFLGSVATDPNAYRFRAVEVCGIVNPRHRLHHPGERILYDISERGDPYWINVHDPEDALPAVNERACVVGRSWRRDGLTAEEAESRGLPNSWVADGLQRPDYVFYPVRCGDGERG